jgi:hypothetical protein
MKSQACVFVLDANASPGQDCFQGLELGKNAVCKLLPPATACSLSTKQ